MCNEFESLISYDEFIEALGQNDCLDQEEYDALNRIEASVNLTSRHNPNSDPDSLSEGEEEYLPPKKARLSLDDSDASFSNMEEDSDSY